MLKIPPLSPAYPVIKPGKINKDDPRSERQQRDNKMQDLEEQQTETVQHIDEIV